MSCHRFAELPVCADRILWNVGVEVPPEKPAGRAGCRQATVVPLGRPAAGSPARPGGRARCG